MTNTRVAQRKFAAGASRAPRSRATFLRQMAEELQRNAETGERLKRRRKALRLTQPQVAELAGVTPRAYQAWEAGGGIAWRHLEPLADALEWTVEAIMGRRS